MRRKDIEEIENNRPMLLQKETSTCEEVMLNRLFVDDERNALQADRDYVAAGNGKTRSEQLFTISSNLLLLLFQLSTCHHRRHIGLETMFLLSTRKAMKCPMPKESS